MLAVLGIRSSRMSDVERGLFGIRGDWHLGFIRFLFR